MVENIKPEFQLQKVKVELTNKQKKKTCASARYGDRVNKFLNKSFLASQIPSVYRKGRIILWFVHYPEDEGWESKKSKKIGDETQDCLPRKMKSIKSYATKTEDSRQIRQTFGQSQVNTDKLKAFSCSYFPLFRYYSFSIIPSHSNI